MGFIPIIFFTLAFIFLWGIVNYNSLRKTRDEILQLRATIIKVLKERKALAAGLLSELNEGDEAKDHMAMISRVANSPSMDPENINHILRHEANRTHLADEFNALSEMMRNSPRQEGVITPLIELTRQLRELRPRIMDLFQSYQNMIGKLPSGFIANLFGFKPL